MNNDDVKPSTDSASGGGFAPLTPPNPTLPKGGGAIRSVGESFRVSPATGTVTYEIPLPLTSGRQGFGPTLALQYDSGSGNGSFGVGWTLSLSEISRGTDKGVPVYSDVLDIIRLSGFEDLVPELTDEGALKRHDEGDHTFVVYRPRTEGAFARIKRIFPTESEATHWQVMTREGVTHVYGASTPARIGHPQLSPERRIFRWLLERSHDAFGNVVLYEYKAEDRARLPPRACEGHRTEGAQRFANAYLKRIRWGNTVPYDTTGASCRFEAVFDYGEHHVDAPTPDEEQAWPVRQDPFSTYRAGFEIRTYRLCRRVLVFHRFPELGDASTLVRALELAYDENPVLTKLMSATLRGYEQTHNGLKSKATPPVTFGYGTATLRRHVRALETEEIPHGIGAGTPNQWVDLDGDGIPGVLSADGGALFYRRNEGGGHLAAARRLPTRPTQGGVVPQVVDVGGDGAKDIVVYGREISGFYPRVGDSWGQFVPFKSIPLVDWNDPNIQLLDVTGNGLEDVVWAIGDDYHWFPALGREGFGSPCRWKRSHRSEHGPTVLFSHPERCVFLADMNGDGLTDLVFVGNGYVWYWPNLGHGRWGARVTMSSPPRFARLGEFDARRIRFVDVDGSGTADILYIGSEGVVWYPNQAGNGWGSGVPLHVHPDALASTYALDVLGTGTACLVWSRPRVAGRAAPTYYVDLMGSKKPHLLEQVTNGMGLETRFRYAPSTKFFLADRAAGKPWATRLPFPVHVVERVETFDYVSRVLRVSEYRYHHGHYDGQEREFRGFGSVEQVDTEGFSPSGSPGLFPEVIPENLELAQPSVLIKSWFHTGSWKHMPAISKQYEKEYYAGDPGALLLPDTLLEAGLSFEEQKQACRALRGQMLRQEVYALDGSPDAPYPYVVTENSFLVRREAPARGKTPGVFFVAPREALAWHYERYRDAAGKADPRTTHAFTLEVDQYGTVRKTVAVAYPRRLAPGDEDHAAQRQLAVTLTETDVVHLADEPEGYRLEIPTETRTYELHGLAAPAGVFSFEGISLAADQAQLISYEELPTSGLQKRLIERVRVRYYDSENLPNPLSFGSADTMALPYESYLLALTPGQIAETFNEQGERVTDAILAEGGYVQLPQETGWWIPSGRQVFDPVQFYLPTAFIGPFGATTTVEYDLHALLIKCMQDQLGNDVLVENDYRTLSPVRITDPNGNRTAVKLDEFGIVVATAIMGKAGSPDGDTLDDPTTTLEYDLFRFQTTGKPNFVKTRAREKHGDAQTRWQESYSYSDGSGHEVMRKVQAEPGPAPELDAEGHVIRDAGGKPVMTATNPRWVGTGRTVFDNKGNPIKKYEPYFSRTHEYEDDAELVHWGVTPILRYDPLGRLIRTDLPNGTFSRVEFTPWAQTSWDENDTVLEPGNGWYAARQPGAQPAPSAAEQRAATLAAGHAGTPSVTELDVLGRAYLAVGDLGGGKKLRTRTTLDIEGNPLLITDARGNDAMMHTFDVAGRKMYQKSVDAGERWMLTDVLGNALRFWDSREHMVRTAYDVLRRPTELWVQQDGGIERLAERTLYGEGHPQAAALNLRGRVYQQFDGAGVVSNEAFDFKGNLLASSRKLTKEHKLDLDWSQEPGQELEAETFMTSTKYDALNRPISVTKPDQSEIRPIYNEAGLLEAVDVRIRGTAAWTPFVMDVDYNEKDQRQAITYGNGVLTEYTYDPLTFRLSRIKTTRPADSAVLQDLRYTYDPVGNMVEIEDKAQQGELFGSPPVPGGGRYVYDAIYRLIQAEGREHPGQQPTHAEIPRHGIPHPNDIEALRSYTELYEYDNVGNILAMIHQTGSATVWRRSYNIAEDSNRLLGTSLPGDQEDEYSATYNHDAHGNMTSMPHLASIGWDFKDQKREVDLGGGGKAYYMYNAAGERVRKVWEHSGIIEERIYLGGYEVYRRREGADLVIERETLHVTDDARRIALVETKTVDTSAPPFTPTPRLRYHLGNHLGSAMLELDQGGLVISYEEYHPYGTTTYHAARSGVEVSAKRYRYTGKERDEETGLYYHGARYYAPWLGRWTAADPAGMVDGTNLYAYVRDNPVRLIDPNGTDAVERREIPVSIRPQSSPKDLSRWSFGPGGTTFVRDPSEFTARSEGRSVFVYDPERATPENNASMFRAELQSQLDSLRKSLGAGDQKAGGGWEDAVSKAEARAEGQKGNPFTQNLALGAGILTQQLGEEIEPTEGSSPHGIVGGRNRGAESSPELQAAASTLQAGAAAIGAATTRLIGRALQQAAKLTKTLMLPPAPVTQAAIATGAPASAARGAPKLHMGQQGKHIAGHSNYTMGRSVLRADPAKLAERAGTGTPVNNLPRGQPGFRERIDFGEVIGDFVKDGVATPTTKGIIHYGKEGIHIVPSAP